MSELNHCNKEQQPCRMPEGMTPFVVYGYPMMSQMPMPYSWGGSEEGCGRYGTMPQYFPQMNVMNPVFF